MTENFSKRLDNVPKVGSFVNQSEDFKVIEIIEHDGKQAVNARDLHQELGNKRKFADWMKQRIEQYGFVEKQDYEVFHNFVKNSNGGRPSDDYALSLDMAKELCMVENNERGRMIRKYFIEVEKAARAKYEQEKLDKKASDSFDIKLKWLNFLPGYLNMSDVSKLAMAKKIAEPLELPVPESIKSEGALLSARDLLKMHNVGISSQAFNKLAEANGYLETLTRTDSKGKQKPFRNITKKGLEYGENRNDKHNLNETHPEWYVDKFGELLERLGVLQGDIFD